MTLINPYIFTPPIPNSKVRIGYLGNMTSQVGQRSDVAEAFDGNTVEINVGGALTLASDANDAIIGYDFSFDAPLGRKIDKVVMYASSGNGFFNASNPTDCLISIEGWNGSAWIALGNTGAFTDANSLIKTIISTDQVTLFTMVRAILSSATSDIKLVAEMEIHEVTAGIMSFNVVESNMTQSSTGDILSAFNGITNDGAINSNLNSVGSTADATHAINFSTPRKIFKGVFYASNDEGFVESVNPVDVQLDLEGWNGSAWIPLGNTGTFTDANSLIRIVTSTDQTTLFQKVRVVISTATSAKKILTESEFYIID